MPFCFALLELTCMHLCTIFVSLSSASFFTLSHSSMISWTSSFLYIYMLSDILNSKPRRYDMGMNSSGMQKLLIDSVKG